MSVREQWFEEKDDDNDDDDDEDDEDDDYGDKLKLAKSHLVYRISKN